MRLGIRRKLIGTLMLVGLFPLVMSLIVILGGGATIQLSQIRSRYNDTASMCADQINNAILHEELEKLVMIAHMPNVDEFLRKNNAATAPAKIGVPTASDTKLDQEWPGFTIDSPPVAAILQNDLAARLALLSDADGHRRHTQVTNAVGEVVAADAKTDDYFQADEDWWLEAWNQGRGKLYISSITTSNGAREKFAPGEQVVEIAMPIFGVGAGGKREILGIMKDELSVSWLLRTLHDTPASKLKGLNPLTQLFDTGTGKSVYAVAGDGGKPTADELARSERFYMAHRNDPPNRGYRLSFNELVMGNARVNLNEKLAGSAMKDFLPAEDGGRGAQVPQWEVVVTNPAGEAMTPVYHLAGIVAVTGLGLILVLFILGVAISNREIIMPIIRLREATAAVGRGELNVRVMPSEAKESTFRRDELGELAHDFDEMTRQLQKNVNQLARSNEAKRRFMELAGHELRTPVTYLLGVCQLAQKQLQVLSAVATDGIPEDETTVALAAKNAASVASALTKISAKTQRLTRIIDNLLKLVNNDQFTTRMDKEPVDIRALILQVTADHRPFMAERKQQLIVDVSQNLPSLEADRDKLEDALSNLVSNAIRFSPDGGTVRVAAHQVIGDMLEILVEDSGPGIPAEEMANLFEPFFTGTDIMHHHSGEFEFGSKGLGLGLAIVRRFIELHGGIVRAQPIVKEGKTVGTKFQILLPLMKVDGADNAAAGGTGALAS